MMQIQAIHSLQDVVVLPALTGAIAAGGHESVQHGQEDRTLDGEFEMPATQQVAHHGLATRLAPQLLEDQSRAPAARANYGQVVLVMLSEDQELLGEARPRGEQGIDLA